MNTVARPLRIRALALLAVVAAAGSAWGQKQVLRIVLDGPLLEAPSEDQELMALFAGGSKARSLYSLVRDIEKSGGDAKIAAIALVLEDAQVGFAQVEEITQALQGFRAKGKKVYCYMDAGGNLDFALACAADHITLAENSDLSIIGLHGQASYYKGLLDKLGMQMEMLHCGAYKSAMEPFVRTEPSKEAAENINWLLDGIYDRWLRMIADGRKIGPDAAKSAIDSAPLSAEDALSKKLIDAVGSFDDFRRLIQKEYGKDVKIVKEYGGKDKLDIDLENPFAFFQVFSDLMNKSQADAEPGLGLIYIEGPISTGKSSASLLGGSSGAGSTTIRAAFERAREDKNVKAVVVRVNSPGGSALASDIMWEAATRCAAEKPVVVSMGSVAGSGGYYVSIPGEVIFADESTITASIGVVGGKMNWNGFWEGKLGITTTEFARGKNAAIMSTNRNWTEGEKALMTKYMNDVYEQFKGRIMKSRGARIKGDLDDMAGGRVFTGKQALERGLIDKIGTLSDAIRYASEKVGLKDAQVYVYPKPKTLADVFKMLTGEDSEDEHELDSWAASPTMPLLSGLTSDPLFEAALPLMGKLAPEQMRSLSTALQNLITISRERAACCMPFELHVR